MANVPLPKCKAILLCQHTILEAGTGLVTLVRTFNQLEVARFPGRTDPFEVFVQLTDGIGRYDVHLEVHDLAEDRVIVRSPARVFDWQDRLVPFDLVVALPPLPVERPAAST